MEIWKDIPGYENLYKISDLGRVNSLISDRILGNTIGGKGYIIRVLYKNNKRKTYKLHQLVAMAFLNHTPCGHKIVVDHINNNKLDNRLENLQVITQRENVYTHYKSASKYKGVSWHKRDKKWVAVIWINGKNKHLGYFNNEYDAHLAYQKELKSLNE